MGTYVWGSAHDHCWSARPCANQYTYLEKTTQTLFLTPHDDQHTISFDQHTIVLISTSGSKSFDCAHSSRPTSQSPDVCEKPEFMLIFTSCEIHIFFTLGLNFTKCEITLVIFTHGEFHHEFTLLVKFTICECCEIHREFTSAPDTPHFTHR